MHANMQDNLAYGAKDSDALNTRIRDVQQAGWNVTASHEIYADAAANVEMSKAKKKERH